MAGLLVMLVVGVAVLIITAPRSSRLPTAVSSTPAPVLIITTEPPATEGITTSTDASESPPAPVPTTVGIVAVDPMVNDSRAEDLARMFDIYFSGINDKRYADVGTVLDPAGSINPGDSKQMEGFARGTRSTTDSAISLTSVADGGAGVILAGVTFQSNQASGDGPKGRTQETCTRWNVIYTVTTTTGFRIFGSRGTSQPC